MKNSVKKVVIAGAAVVVVAGACMLMSMRGPEDFHEKYAGTDLTQDVEGVARKGTYSGYLNEHANASYPDKSIEVALYQYTSEGDVQECANFHNEAKVLLTNPESKVTWKVDIPESGFYNVYMEYLIPESRGVAAERVFYVNGEIPFDGARNITFSRIWKDGGDVRRDNQGNEIRPTQVEVYDWQKTRFEDDMGYTKEPYVFYFEKGANEITLEAENEPMAIRKLCISGVDKLDTYEEYVANQPQVQSSAEGTQYKQIVQGEESTIRSESSLYAKYDRSSPTTQPNDVFHTKMNYIGGESWKTNGQWIEWEFEVPEDGYYNIMVKGRQNYSRGNVSNRTVYIDGEIPFEEMREVSFDYNNDWQCKKLADEDGNDYNFYLTKGTHTIRLEASLGGVGPILEELESSTYRLNQMYRQILVYTGPTPDHYRDYRLEKEFPLVIEAMDLEAKRLFKLIDDTVAYSGQKADQIANAQTVAQQLERFVEKPSKITLEFVTFKDNITSLGTALLNMSESKLDIDYICVTGTDAKPKKDKANIFTKAWHEAKSFVASFVVDYNAVGNVYDDDKGKKDDEVVKVWVLTGRDQGTILKALVDETFTNETGIKVNVEIVQQDALLNAVLAGRGPNVVLSVGADQPVNYALRNAVEDLTVFDGFDEVISHYTPSSYEQYGLDGHIYAIPETQTFNVMFYRKDILDQLGLEPPNTWQELIEMLPTIQGNNLTVGIPTATGSSGATAAATAVMSNVPDLSLYFTLLYQYGGDMYNEAGTKTVVDDEAGIKAFDDYVRYFNDYGLPSVYDFVSRFRSGEMPIGIAAYSNYNTLMVSAPEIRGLWDFTLIPGTEKTKPNGETYIDRSVFITGSATMMIKEENESLRNKSWEFMKWWAEPSTQVSFGREMEALLGASARYATANKDAFVQLSWSADDIAVLDEQWNQTVGIREVPGGYFTGRHISNACRKVINEKSDSRETIIDYAIKIDEEIVKKRKEFGLPIE